MAVYPVLFYKLYTILRLNDIGDMGIFFDTWNSSKIVSKTELWSHQKKVFDT